MQNEAARLLERLANKQPALSPDPVPADLLTALWSRVGVRPPQIFSDLLRSYSWPNEMRLGFVEMYGREPGAVVGWEEQLRRDEALSAGLLRAAFLPFGRPLSGSYDVVCFDTSRRRGNDCPIVQVDHESVLLRDSPRVSVELHPSTRSWVEANA